MIGYVYKLVNPDNGKVLYIGSTIATDLRIRLKGHYSYTKTSNTRLYKYLRENNIVPLIEVVDMVKVDKPYDLRRKEREWQDIFLEKGVMLLNNNKAAIKPANAYPKTKFTIVIPNVNKALYKRLLEVADMEKRTIQAQVKYLINSVLDEYEKTIKIA